MLYKKLSINSIILAVLLLLLLVVHLKIWDPATGFFHLLEIKKNTENQNQLNMKIKQENDKIAAKIMNIKEAPGVVERSARESLGMISRHEKFFQLATKN